MNKLQRLRQIVAGFASYSPPVSGAIDQKWMGNSPLVRGKVNPATGKTDGITKEAAKALYDFTDAIFSDSDQYRRGCTFDELSTVAFDVIMELFGRTADSIGTTDVTAIENSVAAWFTEKAVARHLFIPCDIIPYHAKPFNVGPVSFAHVDDFSHYTNLKTNSFLKTEFQPVFAAMQHEGAKWMADLHVDNCVSRRASELADLAIDIALVGIQLVVPLDYSERMARITARKLPQFSSSVSLVAGQIAGSGTNQQPGLGFHGTALDHALNAGAHVISSVGKRVLAYVAGKARYPLLDQAWNDAAYWFHEGIAEPLDAIAVPKLETAIEVLLRSVNSSGSESRLIRAIKTFYGLEPDQLVHPQSQITVKQFAKRLVHDRSRILHGTWSTLTSDLRSSRSSLTGFVPGLLRKFTLELDAFETEPLAKNDVDIFLNWVQARGQSGLSAAKNEGN
jgi:hypothetical protein